MKANVSLELRRLFTIGVICTALAAAVLCSTYVVIDKSHALSTNAPAFLTTTQDGTGGG